MRQNFVVLPWLALAIACSSADQGAPVGATSSDDTVVQLYNREYSFQAPVGCDAYVFQRIVDARSYVAQYDARSGPHAARLSETYSILARDAYPLRLDISDAGGGPLFTIIANDHDFRVLDSAGVVVLGVVGFDGSAPVVTSAGLFGLPLASRDVLEEALALQRCILPARAELGNIPGFFRNRREGVASAARGIVSGSADAPPILGAWSSDLTLTGAYFKIGLCLQTTGDEHRPLAWSCPCSPVPTSPVVGDVATSCTH